MEDQEMKNGRQAYWKIEPLSKKAFSREASPGIPYEL